MRSDDEQLVPRVCPAQGSSAELLCSATTANTASLSCPTAAWRSARMARICGRVLLMAGYRAVWVPERTNREVIAADVRIHDLGRYPQAECSL